MNTEFGSNAHSPHSASHSSPTSHLTMTSIDELLSFSQKYLKDHIPSGSMSTKLSSRQTSPTKHTFHTTSTAGNRRESVLFAIDNSKADDIFATDINDYLDQTGLQSPPSYSGDSDVQAHAPGEAHRSYDEDVHREQQQHDPCASQEGANAYHGSPGADSHDDEVFFGTPSSAEKRRAEKVAGTLDNKQRTPTSNEGNCSEPRQLHSKESSTPDRSRIPRLRQSDSAPTYNAKVNSRIPRAFTHRYSSESSRSSRSSITRSASFTDSRSRMLPWQSELASEISYSSEATTYSRESVQELVAKFEQRKAKVNEISLKRYTPPEDNENQLGEFGASKRETKLMTPTKHDRAPDSVDPSNLDTPARQQWAAAIELANEVLTPSKKRSASKSQSQSQLSSIIHRSGGMRPSLSSLFASASPYKHQSPSVRAKSDRDDYDLPVTPSRSHHTPRPSSSIRDSIDSRLSGSFLSKLYTAGNGDVEIPQDPPRWNASPKIQTNAFDYAMAPQSFSSPRHNRTSRHVTTPTRHYKSPSRFAAETPAFLGATYDADDLLSMKTPAHMSSKLAMWTVSRPQAKRSFADDDHTEDENSDISQKSKSRTLGDLTNTDTRSNIPILDRRLATPKKPIDPLKVEKVGDNKFKVEVDADTISFIRYHIPKYRKIE